uniref:Uncharacterized protein n=1 Tax=Terrapene triunguis TaxID=2587831 RepID=A0A674JE32_9SAUR
MREEIRSNFPHYVFGSCSLFSSDLTADCCGDLSSALGMNQVLTELDLKWNRQLGDTGVKVLCERLKHPSCRLKKIRFSWCNLTADCCSDLSTVLITNQILTDLDLGENNLGYSGVKLLCEKLKDQNCKLRKIRWTRINGDKFCGDFGLVQLLIHFLKKHPTRQKWNIKAEKLSS